MLAAVSEHWTDIGTRAAVITGVLACLGALVKFARATMRSARRGISAAVDLSDTAHLVRYHLGPNGTTRPVHERLRQLEIAHQIEQTDKENTSCSPP